MVEWICRMLLTVTGERFDAEALRVYPVDDHQLVRFEDQNDRLHGILWTRQVATGVLKVVAFALTPHPHRDKGMERGYGIGSCTLPRNGSRP